MSKPRNPKRDSPEPTEPAPTVARSPTLGNVESGERNFNFIVKNISPVARTQRLKLSTGF